MTGHQAEPRRATWWSRVGAATLDAAMLWAILFLAIIVAAILTIPFGDSDDARGWLTFLLWLTGGGAYYAGTMTRARPHPGPMPRRARHNGQTVGKQAAGIRVVRDDGQPVTLGTVASREWLLKFVG